MPKKTFRPLRIAPLQRAVVEEVTDPAEIVAMEKLHKRLKRMQKKQETTMNGESVKDRPLRIAPLQRAVVEEVTDPAEIAAMEKLHKRLKRMQKRNKPLEVRKRVKKSPKTTTKRLRSSEPRPPGSEGETAP
jgi:hypothetical protein